MKKFIIAVLILAFGLILVTMFVSYYKFKASLPKTTGKIEISGLTNDVEIYRDENGVPHIYAQNEEDLYFSLGYVMAQDRLWQLELVRRLVNGRMSEVFGDTTLAIDEFFLTIGFKHIAGEIYNQVSETSKSVAVAYTDGINSFIESHQDNYPVEFLILEFEPQFWHPEDIYAVSRLMGWELSLAWHVELLAGKLSGKMSSRLINELFGDYLSDWPNIVDARLSNFNLDAILKLQDQIANVTGNVGLGQGSNNWVISGYKSKSGKPILANDPHLTLMNPSRWYMAHLVAPGVNVAGFTIPGSPEIIVGFNQKISWGITNVMNDDVDFIITKISRDSTRYLIDGGWEEFVERVEIIPIKNDNPRRLKILSTRNGPIINAIHPVGKGMDEQVAMRWTGQEFSDDILAFHNLNRAENWRDFRNAIRHFKVPSLNFVFADINGNIGYQCSGYIPIRTNRTGHLPGRNQRHWRGFIPFDQLPRVYNPAKNYLATANNSVAPPSYPYYISHLWEPPSRIIRIRELLEEDKKFDVNDFKDMQMDVKSPFVEFLLPFISPELKELADKEDRYNQMYQFIQGWDMQVRGESVGAALFHSFFSNFLRNTLSDELGEENFHEYLRFAAISYRAIRKIYQRNLHHWFDDKTTPGKIESESDIVLKSWTDTATELENKLGPEIIKWRWDRMHQITFKHFLGDQPLIGRVFNVGPLPMSGSHTTINNGNYNMQNPYDCRVGPSMRMIIDMANPGSAFVINPPGQVGHPFSPHFRDMADFWVNGLYVKLETDENIIKKSGNDLLKLIPK